MQVTITINGERVSRDVEPRTLLAAVRRVRPVPQRLDFDVVASLLGRRNFGRFELADAVGARLGRTTGWTYRPRAAALRADPALSFRLLLDGETATLGLRLAARPLHRRAYRLATRPGSLHPPLARALVVLAGAAPGLALLDPCCGAGTIPIEAKLAEPRLAAAGRDLDPDALAAAARNARAAGVRVDLAAGDAARLRLPAGGVERIVCNPPWNRSAAAAGGLGSDPAALWREAARLLAPGSRLAALVPPGAELPSAGFEVAEVRRVRVAGAEADAVVAVRAAGRARRSGSPR